MYIKGTINYDGAKANFDCFTFYAGEKKRQIFINICIREIHDLRYFATLIR